MYVCMFAYTSVMSVAPIKIAASRMPKQQEQQQYEQHEQLEQLEQLL